MVVIEDNDFQHNWRGISSRATYPNSAFLVVGNLSSVPNKFSDNWFHIESNASKYGPGLSIVNNKFDQSNTAIWLIGPSRYFIENNSFDQTTGGIFCNRTGSLGWNLHNYIGYNSFSATAGIIARGENREMQFLCNDFSGKWDFILKQVPNGGSQGEIRVSQGSPSNAAGNCFTDPVQITDISTENQTLHFKYYVAGEETCKTPISLGNYTVSNSFSENCIEGPNFPEFPTYEDYEDIKSQITTILNNGGQPEEELFSLLELKDHTLNKLVESYVESTNTEGAIQLLNEENSVSSKLMIFGIQMNLGDYTAATATLNTLPDEVDEIATFKQIQHININRLQYGAEYIMSQNDSLF